MIEDAQAAENKARANLLRFRFDFSIGGELDAYRDAVEARVRLADSARIESFYLPMDCPNCGRRRLLVYPVEQQMKCEKCDVSGYDCDETEHEKGEPHPQHASEWGRAALAVSAAPEDWCAFPFYPIVDHEIDREHPRPCGRPESDPVHQPFFADGSPLHVFVAPEEAAHGE